MLLQQRQPYVSYQLYRKQPVRASSSKLSPVLARCDRIGIFYRNTLPSFFQVLYSLYAAGKSVDSIADSPLEYALETAIQTIVKVGGYIILFGILGHLITRLSLPFPLLQGMLAGVLEITTGSSAIAALSLPSALKTALICAVTAFGGLSSVLQTKSVLGSSGLSVATYLYTKVLHALLAAALSGILLLFNVF